MVRGHSGETGPLLSCDIPVKDLEITKQEESEESAGQEESEGQGESESQTPSKSGTADSTFGSTGISGIHQVLSTPIKF